MCVNILYKSAGDEGVETLPASHRIYARIAFGTTFYGFGNLVWEPQMTQMALLGKNKSNGTCQLFVFSTPLFFITFFFILINESRLDRV